MAKVDFRAKEFCFHLSDCHIKRLLKKMGLWTKSKSILATLQSDSYMTHFQKLLRITTNGKSFHNITSKIAAIVAESGVETGLCTLFLRHTSASLVIQENADPDVLVDLANFMAKLVPESGQYIHDAEGADDMPAHIRTALTHTSEHIPINRGHLVLGTWQGIYIWEHRQRSHSRELVVHISG